MDCQNHNLHRHHFYAFLAFLLFSQSTMHNDYTIQLHINYKMRKNKQGCLLLGANKTQPQILEYNDTKA